MVTTGSPESLYTQSLPSLLCYTVRLNQITDITLTISLVEHKILNTIHILPNTIFMIASRWGNELAVSISFFFFSISLLTAMLLTGCVSFESLYTGSIEICNSNNNNQYNLNTIDDAMIM